MADGKTTDKGSAFTSFLKPILVKNSLTIVIAIFLIIVIIKILLSFNFYAPFILPDEAYYDTNAHLLSEGHLYPSMGTQPPLYPLALSMAYHISTDKNVVYHIMLSISSIVTALIIFPAFFILRKYIEPLYAILGACTIATIAALNYYSFTLLLENLFIPLLLFALWAIIEAFDTNKTQWQILAGVSIACLEITKSLGQIIEYSFLLTFLLYLVYNRKAGIIKTLKNNAAMLVAFAVIFSLWHIFLQITNNLTVSGAGGVGRIGTSYDSLGMLGGLQFALQSSADFIFSAKVLLNHFNYLVIASYFIPVFIVYYLIISRKDKNGTSAGYKFGGLFILLAVLFTILSITIIDMGMMRSETEIHMELGRYLDPFLPPIFVFGLIGLYKAKSIDFKIHFVFSIIFMVSFALIITYISKNTLNVEMTPHDYVNNPSLTYLFTTDPLMIPFIILALAVLSVIMLYLSAVEKKFIAVFLLFIIVGSILTSYVAYGLIMSGSEVALKNNISIYLQQNSNDQTLLVIDQNMTTPELKAPLYAYNFWNAGKYNISYIDDSSLSDQTNGKNIYIVTTSNLTFSPVAIHNRYKLYQYPV